MMSANQWESLGEQLQVAYANFLASKRRRWRRAKLGLIAVGAALVVAGAALGAALTWLASEHVQKEIAAIDRGLPADLRLNPDVSGARAVAETDSATLYAADLQDGGYCSEIVTDGGRGRGVTCSTAAEVQARPIDVALPSDDDASDSTPVTLGGRVNVSAAGLELSYAAGGEDAVPLADGGFFLFAVPERHLAAAHESEMTLTARASDGGVLARASIPADWAGPAVPDEEQPLYVSTRSDSSDFTKVYGIEGHVGADGAASLQLRYQDGTRVAIPLDGNSYFYAIPPERQDDFMTPQLLVALDDQGAVVAQAPVAAVAYWTGKQRGR
jgi:hypothetical protein